MLFVADVIPPELRRVVEFLNEQMDPAQVLALEIRQFVGGEMKTLVPRLLGQSEFAQRKKSGANEMSPLVDEPTFLNDLMARRKPAEEAAVRRLLGWASQAELVPGFWKTRDRCSFIPTLLRHGLKIYPLSLRTIRAISYSR